MTGAIKIPEHIAFILDGNRRWAKKIGMPAAFGHKKGADTLVKIVRGANKLGLKYMTVYGFSTENWNRDKTEVNGLMDLFREYLAKVVDDNVRILFIGELDMLPPDILELARQKEKESANNTGLLLCVALSYGSRLEIISATKKIAEKVKNGDISVKDIDVKLFSDSLYTASLPDPDLLIRTSGEKRLSNYLLWQLAYTEFYFTDTLWPDFTIEELKDIIENFNSRERRYGKK